MSARIVFMGTPDFAARSLQELVKRGYNIPAVFTQPDRPRGRGQKPSFPAVKELALEHGIDVHQPTRLRDGEALSILREYAPDLIVVVAYGRILPKEILELPEFGCINLHGSLLPRLRGAAPIQWSVINGDTETGATVMYMSEGMDEGDIIAVRPTAIAPCETAGELFERLSVSGAELLSDTIPSILDKSAVRTPQDDALATYAPMIEKALAFIDFSKSPQQTKNLIRGLNPSPCAYTLFEGKRLRIHKADVAEGFSGRAGEVLDPSRLIVGCGDGALELLIVQPEGKAPMSGADFSNGRRLNGGEKLG